MRRFVTLPLFFALFFCTEIVAQTPATVMRDNGQPRALYTNVGFEESVLLKPDGPCSIVALEIYFGSETPGSDTIWIVGDPAEGTVPPTSWVWSYNTLIPPFIVEHDGTPGWKSYDLSTSGLRADGHDRIVVQHRIDAGGPTFVFDNTAQGAPYGSFIMNPGVNNSLGFPGQFSLAQGDFMVRLKVLYDFPEGDGSAGPPIPTMVDVTEEANLVDAAGELTRSSRVGVVDVDADGFDDIVAGGRFWHNQADGTFELVELGISASTSAWADYDNDGDLDCYAVRGGENTDRLWRNDGNFAFTDVTEESGIDNPAPAITPIFFDLDQDGDLDLFVSNGRTGSFPDEVFYQDRLWLNNGDGTFTDITEASGVDAGEPAPNYDAWGATAGDYDNDGDLDIFVATYRLAPDLLFRNNGDGTMTEVAVATGVHGEPTTDSRYFGHGIGADMVDFDNDGDLDISIGNLGHPDWRGQVSNPSLLYRNEGGTNPSFTEVGGDVGIKFFELNAGVVWGDFDLDGNQDLFHAQYSYRVEGESGEPARLSRLYLSQGAEGDWKLRDMTWQTGLRIHGTWTAASIDFDRDGDLDLVCASPRENLKLYRNDIKRNGSAIVVRLVGDPADGVPSDPQGARLMLHVGDKTYTRELVSSSSGATGTQRSGALHFGIGSEAATADSLVVTWGASKRLLFRDVAVDAEYLVDFQSGMISELEVNPLSVEDDGYNPLVPSETPRLTITAERRSDGTLYLKLPTDDTGIFPLRVVATDGRPFFEGNVRFSNGGEALLMLPASMPAGHYLVGLTIDDRPMSGQFEVK